MNIFQNVSEGEGGFKHRLGFFIMLLNVLVVVIAISFIVSTGKTLQGDETQKRTLNVTGEGKVFVRPDIATFTATVISNAARIGDAQNQNSIASNAIVDFLKKNGVQEKDIKTVNYSVYPQYQYDNRPCLLEGLSPIPCPPQKPPRIVFYQVTSSVEVKVRDLNKVDDLLQGVVSAGANNVGSISFTVEDEKAAMAQARKQAIDDAQAKAVVLARDLGVRIKRIVAFSESGGVPPIYYSQAFDVKAEGRAITPVIQPGEQQIQSTVTVAYEFR